MSFKIVVTNDATGARDEYAFDQDSVVLGRGDSCDLPLPDPRALVSKQHLRIDRAGDSYYVTDLGSKNGTRHNDAKLESGRARPLFNGDELHLGAFCLQFVTLRTAFALPNYERTIFEGAATQQPAPAAVQAASSDPDDLRRQRAAEMLRLTLPLVVRWLRHRWAFQLDFLGKTQVELPGLAPLYSGSDEDIYHFLTNPELPETDWHERLERLERALRNLDTYPEALHAGYQAGIREGAPALAAEAQSGKPLPEAAEERFFRPAFSRAFEARQR